MRSGFYSIQNYQVSQALFPDTPIPCQIFIFLGTMASNMSKNPIPIIAIDGTASSGKGTLAYQLARHFGFNYLNSGALYRLAVHLAITDGLSLDDMSEKNMDKIVSLLQNAEVAFQGKDVIYKEVNIWPILSSQEIGNNASKIAFYVPLRHAIKDFQRKRILPPGLVAEGRDMTTEVFTDAHVKIFLTATVEERARRRLAEEKRRGSGKTYELLCEELRKRDKNDMNRPLGALRRADDALFVDNTNMSPKATLAHCIKICEEKGIKKVNNRQ